MTPRNEDPAAPTLDSIPDFTTRRAPASATVPNPHFAAAARPPTAPPRAVPVVATRESESAYTDSTPIDWKLVTELRISASETLAARFGHTNASLGEVFAETNRAELEHAAKDIIKDAVQSRRRDTISRGENWSDGFTFRLHQAVFDAIFGLAQFQRFVDDETITDVHIDGIDNVWIIRGDGTPERWLEPLAESDTDLIALVQYFATKEGRAFDRANPRLRLALGTHVRLTAEHPPIARRVSVKLRMHRTVGATLESLASTGMLTHSATDFLRAAIRAHKNIVVAGDRGVGKTTLLRALANALDPAEPLVTIEGERELHLDLTGHHQIATSLEAQPGAGLVDVTGRRTGEIVADDLVEDSMRLGAQRVIVGEVLGSEINAMFQVMQAGAGSLSTIHSRSAGDAISRMAGLALKSGNVNPEWVHSEIAAHIDFIVYVRKVIDDKNVLHRWLSDIVEVVPTSADPVRATINPIFETIGRTYTAELTHPPSDSVKQELGWAGLPENFFTRSA
uniref:Putative type II /IV secretion system protein,VirB11-like protein n=1 Tax=Brevibacterium sp. Ap13 TaxID=1406197 RepID=U5NW85_9MICO|nr:CpaF/VirB11 family protein [Brevibacterium sp. Ap13]AGY35373.1 putative type II /IV secretion system protein,VirB11-like protein [Brevibacterium sp. Ap13]